MDYDPKNKIQFAHLTNNCLVKKYNNSAVKGRIDREREAKKSSPKKADKEASPGKESPGVKSPGKESPTKDYDSADNMSGSEASDDDDLDPENIWSLEDFSNHLQTEHSEGFKESDIFRDHIFP